MLSLFSLNSSAKSEYRYVIEYCILECYCTCIIEEMLSYFFHPAKFDNFKDEKISDYKTVVSFTKQKLARLNC